MNPARITTPGALASKVAQREPVARAAPQLAFDLRIFDDAAALHAHLQASERTQVVRPEHSDERGSALLHRAALPLTHADTAELFARSERVVVHEFAAGQPYFVNGVVAGGRLFALDCWRCFSIGAGIRDILTSVVNEPANGPLVSELQPALERIALASGLGDGPVPFELVVTPDGGARVVKFAPRLASEPLPALCRLLGILGQSDAAMLGSAAAIEEHPQYGRSEAGYVADYSFVVRERGTLIRIAALNELRALPSYAGDVDMPEPGDLVEQTRSGETYGATILLKNASEAALLAASSTARSSTAPACSTSSPSPSATTSSSSSSAAACATTASTCSRASPAGRACWPPARRAADLAARRYLEGFTQVDPSDARALVAAAVAGRGSAPGRAGCSVTTSSTSSPRRASPRRSVCRATRPETVIPTAATRTPHPRSRWSAPRRRPARLDRRSAPCDEAHEAARKPGFPGRAQAPRPGREHGR